MELTTRVVLSAHTVGGVRRKGSNARYVHVSPDCQRVVVTTGTEGDMAKKYAILLAQRLSPAHVSARILQKAGTIIGKATNSTYFKDAASYQKRAELEVNSYFEDLSDTAADGTQQPIDGARARNVRWDKGSNRYFALLYLH